MKILLALLCFVFSDNLGAQNKANVGSVLKYTGGPANMPELKSTNLFLEALETQVASEALGKSNVKYIDRNNVNQIFRELNLSSDVAFDGSSGSLRGLLGRLDVLIVIDASSPTLARIRAIDLEDGAVRALGTCKRRSFFGDPSDGDPDCVKAFASRLQPSVQQILAAKQARQDAADKQQRDNRDAEQKAVNARSKAQADKDHRTAAAAKLANDQAEAERRAAQVQVAADEKAAGDRQRELTNIQPDLEGALGRLNAADLFWDTLKRQMAQRGQSLRAEVQTSLNAANSNGSRCQTAFTSGQPSGLRSCIAELDGRLDRLDEFK